MGSLGTLYRQSEASIGKATENVNVNYPRRLRWAQSRIAVKCPWTYRALCSHLALSLWTSLDLQKHTAEQACSLFLSQGPGLLECSNSQESLYILLGVLVSDLNVTQVDIKRSQSQRKLRDPFMLFSSRKSVERQTWTLQNKPRKVVSSDGNLSFDLAISDIVDLPTDLSLIVQVPRCFMMTVCGLLMVMLAPSSTWS